ncbi:29206_t:CDS:1, partial [Racocetra persica]
NETTILSQSSQEDLIEVESLFIFLSTSQNTMLLSQEDDN